MALTKEQEDIMWHGGTEAPFTGKYVHTHDKGMYVCANCGQQLFESDAKYDSGSGWPSFDRAIPGAVNTKDDDEHGMHRVEVTCSNCGAHLGHLFPDGPVETTGDRFCINSAVLNLKKESEEGKESK